MKDVTAKKSKLWLWLTLGVVALLAVTAAVVIPMLGGEEAPAVSTAKYTIYWNIDGEAFTKGSETGLSERTPDENGVFRMRFATGSGMTELTTVDKKLVNLIDAMQVVALEVSGSEILNAEDPANLGYVIRKGVYVQTVSSGTVTCNSSVALNGMPIRVRISDALNVLDVRADAPEPGASVGVKALEALDYVYTCSDDQGIYTYVFLAGRSPKGSVYWRASQQYSSAEKATTREPDENGVYTLDFFCDGQRVELKCKDKAVVNKIDSTNRFTCHFGLEFDEEGYVVKTKMSSLAIKGMIGCSNYVVTELEQGVLVAKSMSGSEQGNEFDVEIDQYCAIYDVSKTALAEGRQGLPVDSLQVGDRIVLWTDVDGYPILAYVTLRLTDAPAYFNMQRRWSSYSKQTLREPDKKGWYYVELLKTGSDTPKTYKTKDKALVDRIDSRGDRTVGIRADGDVLTAVYEAECIFGYTNQGPRYVTTATGSVYSAMAYKNPNDVINGVIGSDCKIYDVSGTGPMGAETTLRVGDLIIIHRNPELESVQIYVTKRAMGVEYAYYNLNRQYDSDKKTTTRQPDKNGYFVFEMAHKGKIVTVKTKSKALATKMDAFSPPAMGLVVKNGIVQYAFDPINISGALRVAYFSTVTSIASDGTVSAVTSTDIKSSFLPAKNCVYYNCSQAYEKNRGEQVSGIKVGDLITGYLDMYGEATVVFILSRDTGTIAWNPQRMYSSATQETTRQPDAEGWYVFQLLLGSEMKTVRTKDKALASKVDANEGAFGLVLKKDVICSVQSVGLVKGVASSGVNGWDVIAKDGSKVTLCYTKPDSETYTGQTREATLAKNLKVYDVSPTAESYGQEVQLQLGDRVRTYVDEKEKVVYAYVLNHATRAAGTEGYCEHCRQNVHWEPWTGGAIAKADRHYYMNCDVDKTVALSLATKNTLKYETVLDLNGKTMTVNGSRCFTVNNGQTMTVLDSVGGGHLIAGGPVNGGVFSVQAGATLNLLGGTIKGTVAEDNKGSCVYVVAGGTVNIRGAVLDGSGMTFGKGAGSTVYSSGTVNLESGELRGGSVGSGGSIYVAAGSLQISGGKISGGQAANYGDDIFVNHQDSVVTLSGGEVSGQFQLSSAKTVTVSGTPKLGDLKLGASVKLTLGALTEGADIAMSASGVFTEPSASAGDAVAYFHAKDSGKHVALMGDVLTVIDAGAYYAACPHCNSNALWMPWKPTYTESGHYFLEADVARTVQYSPAGQDMVLDLHGHTFTATNSRAVIVRDGITFTLLNSSSTGAMVGGGAVNGGVFSVQAGGTLHLRSVTAKGAVAAGNKGSVIYVVAGGTAIAENAVIEGNGAVYSSGAVVISGGEIKGDSGIYINDGSLTVSGGEIPGQIHVEKAESFTVSGAPKLANVKLVGAKLTLGELSGEAAIAVDAAGEFSVANPKAKSYLDAGMIRAFDPTLTVEVTGEGVLYIQADVPMCPHCNVALSEISWQPWNAATAKDNSGHYYLTAKVSRTLQFVPTAADLVIDLRGYDFQVTAANTRAFLVNNGVTLTVMDTAGNGSVSGKRTSMGSTYNVQNGGTLNLCGGTAAAGYAATSGSVVYVQAGGVLNIGGTAILDGSSVTSGAGTRGTIYSEGTVNMTGGEVKGGSAGSGGSMYIAAGDLTISGGKISGGQAANYGDDVFVDNAESAVTISGGEVSGQFQISTAKTVTVSGAPKLGNLKLGTTVKLTLGQLTQDAQIAVAAAGAFTLENAQAKEYLEAGCFSCYTAGKTIREENGVLIIE